MSPSKRVIRISPHFNLFVSFRNRRWCSMSCVVTMRHVGSTWWTSSRLSCWIRAARPLEHFWIIAATETATSSMLPSQSASLLVTRRPKRRKVSSCFRQSIRMSQRVRSNDIIQYIVQHWHNNKLLKYLNWIRKVVYLNLLVLFYYHCLSVLNFVIKNENGKKNHFFSQHTTVVLSF